MPGIVTIGRQYGSGGREVGKILAQKLDIPFYDNELLMIAAEKYGLHPGVLRERDEKKPGSLLYSLSTMTGSPREYDRFMQPYQIFQAECDTIRRLAEQGSCVFIGRCADFALKDTCRPLRVFICASSMEDRVHRAVTVDKIDAKRAELYIRRKDSLRKDYYNAFTHQEWGKMENYDICLNTSTLGYEACAEILAQRLARM